MRNNPPMYSLKTIKYGREKLSGNQPLLIVEGYTDAIVYKALNNGIRTILPINDIIGEAGKKPIIEVSNELPEQFFIVDDDLESIIDEGYRESLGPNVLTTWMNNDIECWCYLALQNSSNKRGINRLTSLNILESDINLALNSARKFGLLRIICKTMMYNDKNTRWKLDFNLFKQKTFQNGRIYSDDVVKELLDSQSRDTVSLNRWHDKLRKFENKYANFEGIRLSSGHDLTFFLHYFSNTRMNKPINNESFKIFEKNFRYSSLRGNKSGWNVFLSGKIGDLLN
tara:strand:- start:18 stop:869 length:852 start_codon:yes stop_codon:yes gene_type:complete